MSILDEIKRIAKDDADLSGIEKMIGDLDPLKNIQTKEEALSFIDRNNVFKSALDAETSRRVENALDRFQHDKLPEILKQKESEWSKMPEESPEQKRIRELEEAMAERDAEANRQRLRAELQEKARSMGYDAPDIDRYTVYGEKALEYLEKDFQHTKSIIDNRVKETIQKKFGKSAIDERSEPAKTMTRADFTALPPNEQMAAVKSGITITNE